MRASSTGENKIFIKFLKPILFGVILGVIATFALLIIFSVVIAKVSVPQSVVPIMAIFSAVIGGFIAGFVASRIAKERGLILGLLCGGVISLLILIAGVSVLKDSLGALALTKFLACIVASVIGGILGVNGKRR